MKKALFAILFYILICVLVLSCKTQEKFIRETGSMIGVDNDTLNLFNDNGDMTGYWLEYLKSDLTLAKKKSEITYVRYAYYWKGYRVLPMAMRQERISSFSKISEHIDANLYGYPLINGEYRIEAGNLFNTITYQIKYENGHYEKFVNYGSKGKQIEAVDYKQTYLEYPFTCAVLGYNQGISYILFYYGVINGEIKGIQAERTNSIRDLPEKKP